MSPATLAKLGSGGNIVFAGLSIGDIVGYYDGVGGVFNQYSTAEFLLPYSGPKFGLCSVLEDTYPTGGKDPTLANAQLGRHAGGPFTATATMPSSFTVTNLSSLSAINRAQPLTINWTGGADVNLIDITVQGATSSSTTTHGVLVQCTVPGGPGTYTIPPAALAYLPAGAGQISVQGGPGGTPASSFLQSTTLTPNLVGGGQVDFGAFAACIAYLVTSTIR